MINKYLQRVALPAILILLMSLIEINANTQDILPDLRYLLINEILYRIPVSEIVKIKTDYQIQDKDIRTFRFTEDNCYASSVEWIKIAGINPRINDPFRNYMVKAAPYYILEGRFIDIDYIYPADLESMSVIPKDEAISKFGCKGLNTILKIQLQPGKKIQSTPVGGIKISQRSSENYSPLNESFTIIGRTTGFRDSTRLYLKKAESGSFQINQDSSYVINNSFTFKGKVNDPQKYIIHTGSTGWQGQPPADFYYVTFYVDNSTIYITDDIGNLKFAKFTGSELQNDFNELNVSRYPIVFAFDSINNALRNLPRTESVLRGYLQEELQKYMEAYEQVFLDFIKTHPKSILSADCLNGYKTSWGRVITKDLFNSLDPKVQNSNFGKFIKEYIEIQDNYGFTEFIDLELKNLNGDFIKLSSLKGKYILLEFWSSWCGPCRAENPRLLKVYNQYKEKGFEIYAVSLDDKKESWQNTVKDDKITWITVSDLKGPTNSKAAMLYEVSAIPRNFLIDREGKIIATDLRGEDLAEKLGEIFRRE